MAKLPHLGQETFKNSVIFVRGEPASSSSTSSGNKTGKSFSGTGTEPQALQFTIGIGAPQYRWRDTPQSLRRKFVVFLPEPCSLKYVAIESKASSKFKPSNCPEFITLPFSTNALFSKSALMVASFGSITNLIGRLYFFANSQSRWS